MENANNELVNEVNQSEQQSGGQYMTRQDIENIVAQGIANTIPTIIAQGIANAIPAIVAAVKKPVEPQQIVPSKRISEDNFSNSVNGGNDHDNHEDEPRQAPLPKKRKAATPGCTYKEFLACKPVEFACNEGATAALRWLEKTEVSKIF